MNISRNANIDKFVNIRYIFFTSPSGIQLIISASPNVEITSPGRWASGFFNPCCPISSKFDMWVDYDVPNLFPTLKNF